MPLRLVSAMLLAAWVAVAPAAGQDALLVYAGRSKTLVEPLIERFEQATGVDVQVRFGTDAQMLATLQEEGGASAADVYWANTAGALAAASNSGLLVKLPEAITSRPAGFVPSSRLWTPVTTRFRVLAYNTAAVPADALPASVLELPDLSRFRGKIGWTPAYSSFQDFVTALRLVHGDEKAVAWLRGVAALEPKAYASNGPMVEALAAGEIDVALTNHYYVLRWQAAHEAQKDAVGVHHFEPGDVGNLALVTGAAILKPGEADPNARRFVEFLLSDPAQDDAANRGFEYPVVRGIEKKSYLLPLDQALQLGPELDLERLRELEATLALMREAGLQ